MSIQKLFCSISVCLVLCVISGCFYAGLNVHVPHAKDVSDMEKVWGSYEKDAVYELNTDVFLAVPEYLNRPVLTPPNDSRGLGRYYSAPGSIEEYRTERDSWPEIKDIVPAGTMIKVVGISQFGAAGKDPYLIVFGEMLDGEYNGQIIDLSDLSLPVVEGRPPYLYRPDDRMLLGAE